MWETSAKFEMNASNVNFSTKNIECRPTLQTQLYTCNVENAIIYIYIYIYIRNFLFYTTRDSTQKTPNFNAARNPLVGQLCADTCREPPKRFVLCGHVYFFSTFFKSC